MGKKTSSIPTPPAPTQPNINPPQVEPHGGQAGLSSGIFSYLHDHVYVFKSKQVLCRRHYDYVEYRFKIYFDSI